MNPEVDEFLNKAKKWQNEMKKLRDILLDSPLTEELKWGHPCYTFENSNVIIVGGFKEYCAISFVKGVLLKDPKNILIQQTENVQSTRLIRFTNLQKIVEMEDTIKDYIDEAIEIEKEGLKVPYKKTSDFNVPEEFQKKLDENPELKTAFKALSPGRQRAYILYFSGAKQSKTRKSRVEKYMDKILNGKGLHDWKNKKGIIIIQITKNKNNWKK